MHGHMLPRWQCSATSCQDNNTQSHWFSISIKFSWSLIHWLQIYKLLGTVFCAKNIPFHIAKKKEKDDLKISWLEKKNEQKTKTISKQKQNGKKKFSEYFLLNKNPALFSIGYLVTIISFVLKLWKMVAYQINRSWLEQSSVIKILVDDKYKQCEIYRRMCDAHANACLNKKNVHKRACYNVLEWKRHSSEWKHTDSPQRKSFAHSSH